MDYKKDYYKILGVDEKAVPEAVRAAYRHLAKLHHPDRNPGDPAAEERFKSINEAYEVLGNEITRHIYDSHRAVNKKQEQTPHYNGSSSKTYPYAPHQTRKTKTYTATREKRIYVQGSIEVKFQGTPEQADTSTQQWERKFTILPTEVWATITSSNIYNNAPPKEYQQGYSTAELFTTPIQQPVNCRIITPSSEEHYLLDLYDIRVKDPVLTAVTKHEQYSFGTLQGKLFGYILHQYEEEVTEEYTEYAGATGLVETKTETGHTFTRQQFYAKDGSTWWTEWKRNTGDGGKQYTARRPNTPSGTRPPDQPAPGWLWLLILFMLVIIWPSLLYILLPLAALVIFFLLLGWLIKALDKILPALGMVVIACIIFAAVRSLLHPTTPERRTVHKNKYDSVSSRTTVIPRTDKQPDTLITHQLHWEDRDSARYEIQLSIPLSALHRSTIAHQQMDEQQYATQGIGAVYRSMLNTDNDFIKTIATAFDSLAKAKSLSRQQQASMIVSCIQSIPYSLIVDRACTANYTDEYISQYLSRCEGECCKGYSKFGVQSPAEFLGDLKGDCDTKALLLYDLLGKLGYQVALMTSNYYRHALIAVALDGPPFPNAITIDIQNNTYYLWETTSKGFGPGELPAAISNINNWNIALIQ